MSQNNNMQILEQNLATSLGTLLFNGTQIAVANRPITTKFDGSASENDVIESPQYRTVTLSTRRIRTESSGAGYLPHPAYVMDFDTATTGIEHNITNLVLRLDPFTVDETYRILVEVYETLPSNYDAEANRPLGTYWGTRVSDTYWYVYMPFFGQDLAYRIKVYAEEGGLSGDLLIDDMFIGTAVGINRPAGQGITMQRVDRSEVFEAESGRRYFLDRGQYNTISSLNLALLDRYAKEEIYNWSLRVGICKPFWLILDPLNNWDAPSYSFTFGAYRLVELPAFSHDFLQYFSTSLSLEEAL